MPDDGQGEEVDVRRQEALKAAVAAGWVEGVITAAHGGANVVDTRMAVGPDLSKVEGPPLCAAAHMGHVVICKLLLLLGADVTTAAAGGTLPLALAAHAGHTETATVLLDSGASIDAASHTGKTALICAALDGRVETAAMLLDRGADLEVSDHSGRTALIQAATGGHTETSVMLLDRGARIEARDEHRWTALIRAARNDHEGTVAMLLDRGANIEAATDRGWTALIHAVSSQKPSMVALLLDRGASTRAVTSIGRTAFDFAQQNGRAKVFGPELMARLQPLSAAAIATAAADAAEAASTLSLEAQRRVIEAGPGLSLRGLRVVRRLGKRSKPVVGNRYYGVNSAVFEMVLESPDGTLWRLAVKVIFNVHQVVTNDLAERFAADYAVTEAPERAHPNVVASLDHFVDTACAATLGKSWDAETEFVREKTLFIAMEWLDQSLKQLISRRSAAEGVNAAADPALASWPPVLEVTEVLLILQRLLRAIVHLLQMRIVHRDIKPDNVLLCLLQDNDVCEIAIVKLADFGESLDAGASDLEDFKMPYVNRDLTKGGAPAFLAPEVMSATAGTFANPVFIDYSKNDVFAAGMVAHYMLTNGLRSAFKADHPHYSADTYVQLSALCPGEFKDLVWAMVNPSFEQRITAEEALARVDALIEGPNLEWGER